MFVIVLQIVHFVLLAVNVPPYRSPLPPRVDAAFGPEVVLVERRLPVANVDVQATQRAELIHGDLTRDGAHVKAGAIAELFGKLRPIGREERTRTKRGAKVYNGTERDGSN